METCSFSVSQIVSNVVNKLTFQKSVSFFSFFFFLNPLGSDWPQSLLSFKRKGKKIFWKIVVLQH